MITGIPMMAFDMVARVVTEDEASVYTRSWSLSGSFCFSIDAERFPWARDLKIFGLQSLVSVIGIGSKAQGNFSNTVKLHRTLLVSIEVTSGHLC